MFLVCGDVAHDEIDQVVNEHVDELVALGHAALAQRVPRTRYWRGFSLSADRVAVVERVGPSGVHHRLAVRFSWDDRPGRDILVEVEHIGAEPGVIEEFILDREGYVVRRERL